MGDWVDEALDDTNVKKRSHNGALAGFSSASKQEVEPGPQGKPVARIEIVASRREQAAYREVERQAAETTALLSTSGYKAPPWASPPPGVGIVLDVCKGAEVVGALSLTKPATVLGRAATADWVLDHPSISRHHVALCYHGAKNQVLVQDLDSAHGTFLSSRRLGKNDFVELPVGKALRVAASSREYLLRSLPKVESRPAASAGPPTWQEAATSQAGSGRGELQGAKRSREEGPSLDSSSSSGRFQDLVQTRVLQQGQTSREAKQPRREVGERGRDGRTARTQPLLKPDLYDWLPPPSK